MNSSESKVTRRDAILTSGKAMVALGAAALLGGQLPKIQPLDGTDDGDDDNEDEQEQRAGGLVTVAVPYTGTDDDETFAAGVPVDNETLDVTPDDESHLVPLGIVPIQFVISEIDTATGGTPASTFDGKRNTVSVMYVAGNTFVHVWTDQQGAQAILPTSSGAIVVGTSVDVEALEDAVRAPPLSLARNFTINAFGRHYLLLAFGFPSTAPSQDDDGDGD